MLPFIFRLFTLLFVMTITSVQAVEPDDVSLVKTRFGDVKVVFRGLYATDIYLDEQLILSNEDNLDVALPEAFQLTRTTGDIVDVILISYSEGSSCAMFGLLILSEDETRLEKPIGNCGDFIDILQGENALTLLFSCLCTNECYESYYSYMCHFSPDMGIACKGNDYCGRSSCEDQESNTFFSVSWDKKTNDSIRMGSGIVNELECTP